MWIETNANELINLDKVSYISLVGKSIRFYFELHFHDANIDEDFGSEAEALKRFHLYKALMLEF